MQRLSITQRLSVQLVFCLYMETTLFIANKIQRFLASEEDVRSVLCVMLTVSVSEFG